MVLNKVKSTILEITTESIVAATYLPWKRKGTVACFRIYELSVRGGAQLKVKRPYVQLELDQLCRQGVIANQLRIEAYYTVYNVVTRDVKLGSLGCIKRRLWGIPCMIFK